MILEDTVNLVDYSVAGKEEVASMILEDTVNLVYTKVKGKIYILYIIIWEYFSIFILLVKLLIPRSSAKRKVVFCDI